MYILNIYKVLFQTCTTRYSLVLFTLLLLISWWWRSPHSELVALVCASKGQYFLKVSVVKLHDKLPLQDKSYLLNECNFPSLIFW